MTLQQQREHFCQSLIACAVAIRAITAGWYYKKDEKPRILAQTKIEDLRYAPGHARNLKPYPDSIPYTAAHIARFFEDLGEVGALDVSGLGSKYKQPKRTMRLALALLEAVELKLVDANIGYDIEQNKFTQSGLTRLLADAETRRKK